MGPCTWLDSCAEPDILQEESTVCAGWHLVQQDCQRSRFRGGRTVCRPPDAEAEKLGKSAEYSPKLRMQLALTRRVFRKRAPLDE